MAAVSVTAGNIRLEKGPVERYVADVALTLGQYVYEKSDGEAALADADGATTAQAIGMVVTVPGMENGATSCAAGDTVDVAMPGAIVTGFSDLTAGAPVFISTTAGSFDLTAPAGSSGDYRWVAGRCKGTTKIRIESWTDDVAAQ